MKWWKMERESGENEGEQKPWRDILKKEYRDGGGQRKWREKWERKMVIEMRIQCKDDREGRVITKMEVRKGLKMIRKRELHRWC